MSFELKNVVPWGRNLDEYKAMFNLDNTDMDKKIISFGDGPASFNSEMNNLQNSIVSLDPIYQFSKAEIIERISETKDTIIKQMIDNKDKFIWKTIKNVDELENIRLRAMSDFIEDFEKGRIENRYIYQELPNNTGFKDKTFDLGLSSHFLILYSNLGLNFHIESITEMLRICKEIRIFPILNLNAEKSEVLNGIIKHFESDYLIEIMKVNYEFQQNGNEMLIMKDL